MRGGFHEVNMVYFSEIETATRVLGVRVDEDLLTGRPVTEVFSRVRTDGGRWMMITDWVDPRDPSRSVVMVDGQAYVRLEVPKYGAVWETLRPRTQQRPGSPSRRRRWWRSR